MIEIKYLASGSDVGDYSLSSAEAEGLGPEYEIATAQEGVKNNTEIFNYASFFGEGLPLDDDSIELGDSSDYYGWLIFKESASLIIEFAGDTESTDFDNGIDITFNKYTCKQVDVYIETSDNGWVKIGEAYNENGLPEKLHLDLGNETYPNIFEENGWARFKVDFALPSSENSPINVKGIFFGNAIEIKNVFEFDMISETNPISDDLAINEMNLTAYIDEEFVGRGGQTVEIYDNGELFEIDILKSVKEQDIDVYAIKTQSKLLETDKIKLSLFQKEIELVSDEDSNDWSWQSIFTVRDIVNQIKTETGIDVIVPELVIDHYVEPFCFENTPTTLRKILQQLAWATCCRIDTSHTDLITLVPFLAEDRAEPDIIINNDDSRILTTNIDVGESYSKILWKIPTYTRSKQYMKIGEIDLIWNKTSEKYEGIFVSDKPFYAYQSGHSISYTMLNPYSVQVSSCPDSGKAGETETVSIKGYVYEKTETVIEIDTGIKNAGTLEISKHSMYLQDFIQNKANQLQKWYSKNNTLTATVVDNDSEIRLGKIIKIQLKKDNYYQGIVTKVVRDNIGDYHTVDLEAHEWN